MTSSRAVLSAFRNTGLFCAMAKAVGTDLICLAARTILPLLCLALLSPISAGATHAWAVPALSRLIAPLRSGTRIGFRPSLVA
jgi:hypothetical protein